MNRKQKIVVSVTGVILIVLVLFGLTYAYYLTQIQGNSSEYSVRATTSELKLVYSDDDSVIAPTNPISIGDTVGEKTFSVTNTGNVSVSYGVYLEEVVNPLTAAETLKYTLTCVSKNKNTNAVVGTCSGVEKTQFPVTNELLVENSINEGIKHEYTLTVEYEESEEIDQTDDMGKTFSAKVNIYSSDSLTFSFQTTTGAKAILSSSPKTSYLKNGMYTFVGVESGPHVLRIYDSNNTLLKEKEFSIQKNAETGYNGNIIMVENAGSHYDVGINDVPNFTSVTERGIRNPYSSDRSLLAFNIINNAKKRTNGTELTDTPLTNPGYAVSSANERELIPIDDNYTATTGKKSFYYRGSVQDNYVDFAGLCWRIVRIEGDGSIKLILASIDSTSCYSPEETDWISTISYDTSLNDWYSEYLYDYDDFIKNDTIYLNDGQKYNTRCPEYFEEEECLDDPDTTHDYEFDTYYRLTSYGYGQYLANTYYPRLTIPSGSNTETTKISSLTPDEAVLAGMKVGTNSSSYITENNDTPIDYCEIEEEPRSCSWYLGIADYSAMEGGYGPFVVDYTTMYRYTSEHTYPKRPTITLLAGTLISNGDGTIGNPYIIDLD